MSASETGTPAITLFTIGYGRKGARQFFSALKAAGVRKVIDVRLNNTSQLVGFTKRDDLVFFLEAILGLAYEHRTELAPTKEMLEAYRGGKTAWPEHERRLRMLYAERAIERTLAPRDMDGACLLCSEPEPEHCHRQVVAEHLKEHWGNVTIRHLSG